MGDVSTQSTVKAPTSDLDLWSDAVLENPYPAYRTLRDLAPAVWMTRHDAWAVTRFSSIRAALLDAEVFTSREGISMNAMLNQASDGIMLLADDPVHRRLRRVFQRPLLPQALATLAGRLQALAEARVDALIEKGEFDAVTELAHYLPLTVVTELLGLSAEGKENMLYWAAGLFDAMGPDGYQRTVAGQDIAGEAIAYLAGIQRSDLDPEGWGAALFVAADNGELSPQEAQAMLMDYLGPALDTTINGLSSALHLLGRNPDQWELLRANPERVSYAIDETLRMESPIRAFTRVLTRDHELDGVAMAQGDRAIMLYAAANRDERHYPDPDKFDIMRDARDHVAFGYGTHQCAGKHLGKLEIKTVLDILLRRVRRFEIVEETRSLHNTLRGLSRLKLRVEAL